MYENQKRAKQRLSQALVQPVTARANVFTDHGVSGLPMRAKKRFKKFESKFLEILPSVSSSSFLN